MGKVDYEKIYNRLYYHGYHKNPSRTHAKRIAKWVYRNLDFESILDVGCARGWAVDYFKNLDKDAYGCDVSSIAVKHCRSKRGLQCRVGNILDLPYERNEFDVVLCTDVLEHIAEEDVERAVKGLRRVAKKAIALRVASGYSQGVTGPKDKKGAYFKAKLQKVIPNLHLTMQPSDWWAEKFVNDNWLLVFRQGGTMVLVKRDEISCHCG